MRRRIAVAIGIAVSGFFLWLAFRNTDFDSIRDSLAAADAILAVPFLLSLFAFYWLKSTRWKDLLSPVCEVRARDMFPIVMIGYAGTAVLPMQMGELVRAYIAAKKYELPYALVLSSIGMERIFDLLTILALLGTVLATGQSTPPLLVKAGYVIGALTIFGLLSAIVLATHKQKTLDVLRTILAPLPARVSAAIVNQLEAATRGLGSVTRPRLFVRIAVNSLLQWALMGICIWFSLLALDIQVPLSGVVLVLVATIVGISLPTSPGYVGNIQLAFVVALQAFGVPAADAIAASIFYHIIAYLAVVIVGFSFVHKMGYGIFRIQAEARASVTET